MFPDECEKCGRETDDLHHHKKDEVTSWYVCEYCLPSTFAGIPIPLTMETILWAYEKATERRYANWALGRVDRQIARRKLRDNLRARILRMDAEKDIEIASLADCVEEGDAAIEMYERQLAEKDARIAELEELVDLVNKHRKERMIEDKKAAWELAKELADAKKEQE